MTKSPLTPRPKKRLSREGWLAVGMVVLSDPSTEKMTVELICNHAKKTTGGFYFHFEGMADFLLSLAQHWRETHTQHLINQTSTSQPSAKRLDRLNYLAVHLDHNVEQAVRRLAMKDPAIGAIVAQVDATRVDYLANLYTLSERYNAHDARALARIEYAAFIGMQQTEAHTPPNDLVELYADFMRLTGRG